ncbi:hypothetical protein HYW42_03545 [Candidatus Daviesbacteria bacterium]|nr:hypothetical protein [Candidatus Daviesbacteria bacterium]
MQNSKLKVAFLGTPDFVKPIKDTLASYFNLVNQLTEANLAVIAAYGKILTTQQLNAPKFGCINVHPSLLPKYRGPSPIQEAIINGDKTSGITIIKIDQEVDHGPIIYAEEFILSDQDTFESLSKKMFLRANEFLPQVIEDFMAGKIKPVPQDDSQANYCKLITKEAGYFDITTPPDGETLNRMIRAYYPWPTTWTKWNNKIVKFYPEGKIQMEGKKILSLKDFLNGYPDFPLKELAHNF